MVALVLGLRMRPDARRRGRCAGGRDLRRQPRARQASGRRRRSSTARRSRRSTRGESRLRPGRPRGARQRATRRPQAAAEGRRRDRLGRGHGRGGRARLARHRGRRDRLPGVRVAGDPRRRPRPGAQLKLHTYHLVREDQQALYGFRTAEELGFFDAAADRDRRRPEGRAGDRRLAPDARPPARDHGSRTRRCSCRSRASARSSPSGSSSSSRRRSRRPALPRGGGAVAGGGGGRGRGRRRAPGARLLAGRGARGVAGGAGRRRRSAATLEDRVKAALRSLLRD